MCEELLEKGKTFFLSYFDELDHFFIKEVNLEKKTFKLGYLRYTTEQGEVEYTDYCISECSFENGIIELATDYEDVELHPKWEEIINC